MEVKTTREMLIEIENRLKATLQKLETELTEEFQSTKRIILNREKSRYAKNAAMINFKEKMTESTKEITDVLEFMEKNKEIINDIGDILGKWAKELKSATSVWGQIKEILTQ